MTETERKPLPPYVPYKTFVSFLEHLRAIGMPSHIDKSVMTHLSGGMQSWLKAALRYLALVKPDDTPTDMLEKLATAQGDDRKKLTREIFNSAYSFLNGKADLKNTTPAKLRMAVTDLGAQGETVEKILAFMIAMAKDAQIPLSPLLTKRAVSARKPRAKTQQPPANQDTEPVVTRFNGGSTNTMKTVTLPIAKGSLTLSGTFNVFELAGDERDLVFTIIDKMKEFEAAHAAAEEDDEP